MQPFQAHESHRAKRIPCKFKTYRPDHITNQNDADTDFFSKSKKSVSASFSAGYAVFILILLPQIVLADGHAADFAVDRFG